MELPEITNSILALGIMLALAMLAGRFAARIHLPKVTVFLLVGLFLGYINLIDSDSIHSLEPLSDLAMVLVLFTMGCHFPLSYFRRVIHRLIKLSLGEIILTFVLVSLGLLIFGNQDWQTAMLFGALAVATAPATTVLVLKENESEGPLTEYTIALVAINNLVAIIVFEVLFTSFQLTRGSPDTTLSFELLAMVRDLGVSFLFGIGGGLAAAYCCSIWDQKKWILVMAAIFTILLGFGESMHIPWSLTFLAMGMTLANSSDRVEKILAELDHLTGLLCVVFFVIHGAELDVEMLKNAGLIGIIYSAMRILGKYFGIFLTCEKRESKSVRNWLGTALLSQAGAAILLASIAVERDPEIGRPLQTVILGSVVFFELIGPIFVRLSVLRSGEVPLDKAIHHTSSSMMDEIRAIYNRVLLSLGIDPWKTRSVEELDVKDLMRKNYTPLVAKATFRDVIQLLEHSHDNTFPVVSDDKALIGVIRYRELRNSFFDMEASDLICAADMAMPSIDVLHPNDKIEMALKFFRNNNDDVIPVLKADSPHPLIGVVARRDLFRFLMKTNNSDEKTE